MRTPPSTICGRSESAPGCFSSSSCPTAASRRWSRATSASAPSGWSPASRTSSSSTRRSRAWTPGRRARAASRAGSRTSSSATCSLHPQLADEAQFVVQQAEGPDELADIVAAHLQTEAGEKQALLEIVSTQQRLLALLESLAEENAVLGIEQEIGLKVQQRVEGAQRQMLLHEKLRVLRDEIEEAGEAADEDIAVYARRAAEAELSPGARKLVTRELTKLRQAPPMSPEVAVIRGFLDTVLELPWGRLARGGRGRARRGAPPGAHALRAQGRQGPHPRVPRRVQYADRRGSRCRRAAAEPPTSRPRSSVWPARPAPARAASRRASPMRLDAPSCASRSAACATRPRSAGIAAPTSGRCPGASSTASRRQASTIPSCSSTSSTSSTATGAATPPRR